MSSLYDPANPTPGQDPYAATKAKAVTDAQAAGQSGLDAITRRYAAMGNLNSGSYAQALGDNARNTQQQQEGALANIDQQQVTQSLPFQQQQIQNTFQGGQNAAQLAQQQGQFTASQGQQASQFAQQLPLQSRQLDLEASQQALDKQANDISQQLGQQQLKQSGGLFGGGGFLGLGF